MCGEEGRERDVCAGGRGRGVRVWEEEREAHERERVYEWGKERGVERGG